MFVGITNESSDTDPNKFSIVKAIINIFRADLNFLFLPNTTKRARLKNMLRQSNTTQYMDIMFL